MIPTPSPTPRRDAAANKQRAPALTSRDLHVLEVFRALRFVETRHLLAMLTPAPYPTPQKLRLRLPKLERLGLLTRPARRISPQRQDLYQLAGSTRRRGRPEDVWALAQRGADLLHLDGDWNKNNGRLRSSAFAHPLMISSVYTVLHVAMTRGLVDLDNWTGENDWRQRIRVAGHDLPLVPDATFLIGDNRTDREARVLLEVDNHSEPLTRSGLDQTSFLKKTIAYWHYWDRVIRPTGTGFIVLTIAKSPERAERLRLTAARTDPHARALNLFWFTSEDRWSIADPETFLYRPIWRTAGGETRALFAPF